MPGGTGGDSDGKTVERREDRSARQVRALVLTALLAAMARAATMAIRPTTGDM